MRKFGAIALKSILGFFIARLERAWKGGPFLPAAILFAASSTYSVGMESAAKIV